MVSSALVESSVPEVELASSMPRGQYIRFSGVSWEDYESFGRLLADRPVRITYDRGDWLRRYQLWVRDNAARHWKMTLE